MKEIKDNRIIAYAFSPDSNGEADNLTALMKNFTIDAKTFFNQGEVVPKSLRIIGVWGAAEGETVFIIQVLLKMIEREKIPPLEEVSEIHMSRSFGIDCYTQANGLEVKMGKDSFGEKLRRLSIAWSDLRKRGLSTMSIDCSDLDKIVVKKSHGG